MPAQSLVSGPQMVLNISLYFSGDRSGLGTHESELTMHSQRPLSGVGGNALCGRQRFVTVGHSLSLPDGWYSFIETPLGSAFVACFFKLSKASSLVTSEPFNSTRPVIKSALLQMGSHNGG